MSVPSAKKNEREGLEAIKPKQRSRHHGEQDIEIQNDTYHAEVLLPKENPSAAGQGHQKPVQYDLVNHQSQQGTAQAVPGNHDRPGADQIYVPAGLGSRALNAKCS